MPDEIDYLNQIVKLQLENERLKEQLRMMSQALLITAYLEDAPKVTPRTKSKTERNLPIYVK